MNRLYSSLLATTVLTFTAAAQQLPNNGFEEAWAACTPWVSGSLTPKTVGQTPANWKIAQVAGYYLGFTWAGATEVGEKSEPGFESATAVKIFNAEKLKNNIPGYITLGTPWNTATPAGNNKDGGSFGGISFSYLPDALSFRYKRELTSGSTEQATVVAYTWKGTWTQVDVPGNVDKNPTKTTITDRDRNILGMTTSQGGTVTKTADAALLASLNYAINGATTEWTYLEIPFEYQSTETPQKINVIFSAGNYFSTSPVTGNSLTIDNVKLLYYSRLKSLKVNNVDVANFDSKKYEYTVEAAMPTDVSEITAECLGNSGSSKAEIALDAANNKATITVNHTAGMSDEDGAASHVYTLNFKAPQEPATVVETMEFVGTLNINMDGEAFDPMPDTSVFLEKMSDGTYTFLLKQFMGDNNITFENVKLEGTKLSGTKDNIYLKLGDLDIHASGTLEGTLDGDKMNLTLNILWHQDETTNVPIDVTFNGDRKSSAIGGIEVDDVNAPTEYYNIQGVKVSGENLAPGFYIVRQGKKVSKIFVK